MSDFGNAIARRKPSRKQRAWILGGMALAAALAIAAPGRADTAEDLNYAELNQFTTTAPAQPTMPGAPQPAAPTVLYGQPAYSPQANPYPADVDCNNPYYTQYCQAYAAWLAQYYAYYNPGYSYGYPYDDWGYGYGYPFDVALGIGVFNGHRFHNFHHFAFVHGFRGPAFHGGFQGGFHGGFHGGGFHGGGFHGGGFHGGGGGHR